MTRQANGKKEDGGKKTCTKSVLGRTTEARLKIETEENQEDTTESSGI